MRQCLFTFLTFFCLTGFSKPITVPKTQLTANKQANLHTTSGTLITITQQQIQSTGAHNLSEILQHVASIFAYGSNNLNTPVMSMRGFGDNAFGNTLILLNGFPLQNPDMSNTYLNLIPVSEIARIEILPESAGVLYGNGAVGGVINIITKTPERFNAGITLGAGSYNGNSQSINIANKQGHFYYYVLAKRLKSDNNRRHNDLNENNGLAKIGYNSNNTKLYFQTQAFYENLQYPGSIQAPDSTGYESAHLYFYQLHLKQRLNDSWQFTTFITKQQTNTWGNISGPFTQNRNTLTLMPELIGALPIDNILTTSGITYNKAIYHFKSQSFSSFNKANTAKTQSAYTHWRIPLKNQFSVVTGIRYAYLDNTLNMQNHSENAFVSEQSLVYSGFQSWRFYLRRAGNYRFPRADETGENDTQLKVQTGVSYELGARFQKANTQLKFEAYLINLNHEIAFAAANPDDLPDQNNRNLDPTQRLGFLINVQTPLTQTLTLIGNLNLVQARYRSGPFKNKTIPMVPEQLAKLAGRYKIDTHWSFYLAGLYTGSSYPAEDDANQNKMGGYVIYNSNLSYQLKRWRVSFRINNLLDKKYNSYTTFSPFSNLISLYPAPGRNFWVTVNYDLS